MTIQINEDQIDKMLTNLYQAFDRITVAELCGETPPDKVHHGIISAIIALLNIISGAEMMAVETCHHYLTHDTLENHPVISKILSQAQSPHHN